MAYATSEQEEEARSLGYIVTRSAKRGSSFTLGARVIWSTRMGWQTADLMAGYYRNHKFFEDLDEALRREL